MSPSARRSARRDPHGQHMFEDIQGAPQLSLADVRRFGSGVRRTGGRLSCPSSFAELTSGWKAGPGVELGRARLQVAQGRCGMERERFVIVRLHPALNGDCEGEHPHFRP